MKKETITVAQRRDASRRGTTAALLRQQHEDYFTPEWMLLGITYIVMLLIATLFTPYTHQLDEIKNMFLRMLPPFMLLAAVLLKDFRSMSWKTHASTFFLGGYVLALILSWIINPYRMAGERVVWFQVACITFTVVFAWFMNSENKLRTTMRFIILLNLWSVVVGLFLFAGRNFTDAIYAYMKTSRFWRDHSEWITLFYTLKSSKQMYSWILNEDFYAAYLVMLIPVTLTMFFVETRMRWRAISILTFLFMNICLFLTNSNDSFLAMTLVTYPVLFLLLFFFPMYKFGEIPRPSLQFVLTLVGGVAIIGATSVLLGLPQILQSWNFKSDAFEGRKVLWSGGFWPWIYGSDWTRSSINPITIIFGTGPGGYHNYFPLFRRPDFFDNQINNVTTFGHNIYLDVLCETGLLGIIAFLGMYFRVLYDAVQQIRFSPKRVYRLVQIGLVAGLCGIALQNFFSPNNRWAVCGMIYWTMFGLSMGVHHIENAGERKPLARGETEPITPLVFKVALAVLAGLFLMRSPLQAYKYWIAAKANNDGLRAMEYAEVYPDQKDQFLSASRRLFEKAISYNPTFVTSYYKLGNVYSQLAMTSEAVATYERLNTIVPHYSEIHLNLGIMYSYVASEQEGAEQLRYMQMAYEHIKEAAREELKPNVQAMAGLIGQELAHLYETQDKKDEALKIYEEIKKYYRSIVDYNPKLEELKIEKKKQYAKAQNTLVVLARMTGNNDEVQSILERMYHENPATPTYFEALMMFFDTSNRMQQKAEFLEKAVHEDPLNVDIRLRLSETYLAQNKMDQYKKELKRVAVLDPKNLNALSRLYLAAKSTNANDELQQYKEKLQELGVSADTITTAIDDRATTALLRSEARELTATAKSDALTSIATMAAESSTAVQSEPESETKRTMPAPETLTTASE